MVHVDQIVTPGGTVAQAGCCSRHVPCGYAVLVTGADGTDGDAAQRAAFRARAGRIMAMSDLAEAFEEAGKLVKAQLEFRHDAAELRAEVARRIRFAGELSIGQLALRLGVSKSRAARMLLRAEKKQKAPEAGKGDQDK